MSPVSILFISTSLFNKALSEASNRASSLALSPGLGSSCGRLASLCCPLVLELIRAQLDVSVARIWASNPSHRARRRRRHRLALISGSGILAYVYTYVTLSMYVYTLVRSKPSSFKLKFSRKTSEAAV